MRIVIELKKDSNPELIISNLYKKTTLQTNFGAIFLALIKGKPIQLNLKQYLNFFLEFREETIRKRTDYFLKNTLEKLEILEGLFKATKDIKKVIGIIESSENSSEAKSKLIDNFFLSEKQANSVLDMPLKKLTSLERNQIDDDIKKLQFIASLQLVESALQVCPDNVPEKIEKEFKIETERLKKLQGLGKK